VALNTITIAIKTENDIYQVYILLSLFKALKQELTFSSHLAMPSVLIPLKHGNVTNLARILNEHLVNSYANQVSSLCLKFVHLLV
jgi:hypothetical protein